jgi:DHA1 family inner membrane transport protein
MTVRAASRLWIVPILGLLAITFTICTAELVIAGLLPTLAADLRVDIPTAGLLITGYAIGVAIAGPILALATSNVPRKTLLLAILATFILGNILCALSLNYWMLLTARILMSACHGLYFGVAVVLASRLAPPGRQASAVSLVTAGVTIAIIVGVPIGTAIGNAFGWRMTFWITAGAGALASLIVAWLIPAAAGTEHGPAPDRRSELRAAIRPVVLLSYVNFGVPLVAFFALLSYAVPFMTEESGIPLEMVPLLLLAMGVASFLGTLLGGRLGDWNPAATLIGITATNTVLFVLLTQFAANIWASVTLFCLIWFVGFMMPAPLQSRVLRETSDAPNLAATLMNTASQIGIAGGAAFGAFLISSGFDYSQIPLLSAVFYALGLVGVLILIAYDRRRRPVAA